MAEVEIPQPEHVREHAANPFTRRVALSVAVYAVGLAVAAFGGHVAAKEMMLFKQEEAQVENAARQEEFNTWGQYQSKSTREALYKNERTRLEFEKEGPAAGFPAFRQKQLDYYAAEEKRMTADKEGLAAKAKEQHEAGEAKAGAVRAELHKYQKKDPYFEFAEVVFQVAIVLASVAMLAEKRWAFATSVAAAAVGALLTANGFLLLDAGKLLAAGHH